MTKKMKGVVAPVEPLPYGVYQDQRARLRHQNLLQDYEDLQQETDAMKRRLEATKQKKLMLAAEVRFLRRRYKYLLKNPSPKPQPKKEVLQPQKLKALAPIVPKGRNYNRKESNLRPPTVSHLKPKERVSSGVEVTLPKTSHVFDLNQNARSFSKNDAPFKIPAPSLLDLNHKDRTQSGKEATKKSITPFFDLNQISTEEQELQEVSEPGIMIEEPKRSTQRVVSDEQHNNNDIKLSVCRNIGDGSNRTGKRKISWQDQVALRV